MSTEQTQEMWQIESNGQIFDTSFEEITSLIDRGELLRMDRVRKDDLRWIEAGKVPSLLAVFNAKDGDDPAKPVITLTKLGSPVMPDSMSELPASAGGTNVALNSTSFPPAHAGGSDTAEQVCVMHDDFPAAYVCSTCFNNFCKACPKSYGGTVKICPYCGAMCESLAKVEATKTQATNYSAAMGQGFGFDDFFSALAYPFKFKTSLILGAIMYAFFSIGQGAMGFGGIFMMGAALGSYLLANTLTFGILSNTIESFAQGKLDENFMPSFDDFSVWDDVIQPFFLSIGVWISSFGPLFVLMIVSVFFVANTVTSEMNGLQSDAARTVNPELPYAAKATQQSQAVRDLINRTNTAQKQRIEQMEKEEAESYDLQPIPQQPHSIAPEAEELNRKLAAGTQKDVSLNSVANDAMPVVDESEEAVMRANESIKQMRQAQAEAIVGKSSDTKAKEQSQLWAKIVGFGAIFLLFGGICLFWGLFYFPVACAVAGYTQSFAATLNPTVGLDTIKRLGFDYVKILLMSLAVLIMFVFVYIILNVVFSSFDMLGNNIPATVIGSIFGFYFSIVFSCVLGFAMLKASDRLKLPS